jgi:hypothetical protein
MRRGAGTRNGRCRRDTARRDVGPSWTVGLLLLSAVTSPAWAGDGVFEALAIAHVSGAAPAADFDLPMADGKRLLESHRAAWQGGCAQLPGDLVSAVKTQ